MNNQLKFNWNIKANQKTQIEIYDHAHVIRTICKLGDAHNSIKVIDGHDADLQKEITISFDGHYSHILNNVALIINALRGYVENQKGTFEKVIEKKSEED